MSREYKMSDQHSRLSGIEGLLLQAAENEELARQLIADPAAAARWAAVDLADSERSVLAATPPETLDRALVLAELGAQDLDGNGLTCVDVPCLIYEGHPALAELPQNLVPLVKDLVRQRTCPTHTRALFGLRHLPNLSLLPSTGRSEMDATWYDHESTLPKM